LCGSAPITLAIRGRDLNGIAESVVDDKAAITTWLAAHLRNVPSDAKYYGVTFDERGNLRTEEVEKAVQTVVMIRVRLSETLRSQNRFLRVTWLNVFL